jgi:hypothetical protein
MQNLLDQVLDAPQIPSNEYFGALRFANCSPRAAAVRELQRLKPPLRASAGCRA